MSLVETKKENGILRVTLSRPEAHNALNSELIKELTQIFKSDTKDQSILAVVLKGNGPSFCAGGDLKWMKESLKFNLAQNIKDAQKLSDMYEFIYQCPTPVLAHIHGNVMGGGVGLTAVCDIVAAEIETKFCFSEVKLGLVPSIISPYVLRKIPESSARLLMMTAEIFKSPHAKDMGLIHFVGHNAECELFLEEKLKMITKNGPEAVRATKNLIDKVSQLNGKAARTLTVKTIAQRRVSKEGQEGMNAFFEKRDPNWRVRSK
jgi:methylglutaconyl-CoA hydratase